MSFDWGSVESWMIAARDLPVTALGALHVGGTTLVLSELLTTTWAPFDDLETPVVDGDQGEVAALRLHCGDCSFAGRDRLIALGNRARPYLCRLV